MQKQQHEQGPAGNREYRSPVPALIRQNIGPSLAPATFAFNPQLIRKASSCNKYTNFTKFKNFNHRPQNTGFKISKSPIFRRRGSVLGIQGDVLHSVLVLARGKCHESAQDFSQTIL